MVPAIARALKASNGFFAAEFNQFTIRKNWFPWAIKLFMVIDAILWVGNPNFSLMPIYVDGHKYLTLIKVALRQLNVFECLRRIFSESFKKPYWKRILPIWPKYVRIRSSFRERTIC